MTISSSLASVYAQLTSFANLSNFWSLFDTAFGSSYDSATAATFKSQWQNQDFSQLPTIEVISRNILGNARGAYASSTNIIYLSDQFVATASSQALEAVLIEEIGHFVDAQVNKTDTLGDEGELFSAVVRGVNLSASDLSRIKTEDDTAIIFIDGQAVQVEEASLSLSGGVGGTNGFKTLKLDPLTQGQTKKIVTLTYFYEHYTIPDQFELKYDDKVIFSTMRVVSGTKSGILTFEQFQGKDDLNIFVTAPQSGTAWDFSVSTEAKEITVQGLLGDVIEINLGKQAGSMKFNPTSAELTALNAKGKLIDEKGNDAIPGNRYDTLYYVPKVSGTILTYGQARQGDLGLGGVAFSVEDQDQKSITVKVNVTDGFSVANGSNPVITTAQAGTLDEYSQEQRLAYLGFPGKNGTPLTINGKDDGDELSWAKKLFNIAVRPEIASARGRIANQDDKSFKNFINSTNAPKWNFLNGAIANLDFPPASNQSQRFYGTDLTGDFVQLGTSTLNRNLKSTGVSQKSGTGAPSSTHDGGRSIDIDDIPGSYFFNSIGVGGVSYVAAQGGGFVVKDGNTYRAGNPNNPADVTNGVRTNYIVSLPAGLTPQQKIAANAERKAAITAINQANLFVFSQTIAEVQTLLDAFSGSPRIFYNDPRFFDTGVIRYAYPHFDHIHFEIPIPQNSASTNQSLPFNSFAVSSNSLDIASSFLTNTAEVNAFPGIIDLGNLEDSKTLIGTISTTNPEQYYSFTIGSLEGEEYYFTTPRDFNLLLDGLSGDVDVELFQDFSEDGIRQDGEVIASSTKSGNQSETINLTNLDEGAYFLRVFQKSGDTSFNLSLTVPPLPVPTDNAGNTVTNAKNLGTIGNNAQQPDFIGQVDTDDYYRFTLSSTNDLNVDVTNLLNGDLFTELGQDKNNDGILSFDEIITVSDEEGDASENINRTGLAAGDYVLHLGRNSGNTNYYLNLSATLSVIPTDKAGRTLATAFDLGTLTTSTQNDFVGNVDPIDYYRFTLTNPSGLTLSLSGLSADADLELSQDKNGDGEISSDEIIQVSELTENQDETIDINALAAGNYFVKVSQYEGDTTYDLLLTPKTAVGVDLEVTVTPITNPLTLGENLNYTITVKNIGASSATGVIVKDNLPAENVLNVSAVASKGSANVFGNEINANIGTLNINESATLIVSGELVGSGPFSSLIEAVSTDADFSTDNNSIVQRFNVASGTIQPADLELSLTSDKTTANIDDLINFTITLTNNGPGAATSIQVKSVLPQGLTLVSSTPQQGSYDSTTGIWDAANIAKDNQAFIDIVAKVTSTQSLSLTAEVISVTEPDPDSTPNNNNLNEDDQAEVLINKDNNPLVPPPPERYTIIESQGIVKLLEEASIYFYIQNGNAPLTSIKYLNRFYANSNTDWQPLAAETIRGENQVLWKNVTMNQLGIWKTDTNWNWLSSDVWDLNSPQTLSQEALFEVDANGDGVISGFVPIESVGNTTFVKDFANQLFAQVGTTTPISLQAFGQPISQSSFPGWEALAVETINGENQVLWKNIADQSLYIWKTDSNWNWLSSEAKGALSSSQALDQETIFGIDANGDGSVGNSVALNLTGTSDNDTLIGGSKNDVLTGLGGKDILTGGLGSDKFDYKTLTDSLLANFDVITDFNANAGNDLFLVTTTRTAFNDAGVVATLDAAGIGAVLNSTNFAANYGASFRFGADTFVAINDGIAGFDANTDALVKVPGLIGTLSSANFTTV
jgi:uncharacterized repeat protein (TIGR01451 family)